jgi:hypothetical protein
LARPRQHHQVQVFHRDGANHHLIADHQRTGEPGPVLEAHLERTDIRHHLDGAVGEHHFALGQLVELQTLAYRVRDAHVDRAEVGQPIDLQGERRHARIAQ